MKKLQMCRSESESKPRIEIARFLARIKNCRTAAVLCVALAAFADAAEAAIIYVDATDGVAGNTMIYTNATWQTWSSFIGQTAVSNDGIWDQRANGNAATVFQNAGDGLVDTNASRLRMSITVPPPGPHQYYNVYALFWTDGSTTWRAGASTLEYPGQLPVYQQSSQGVTRFWASAADTSTIYSDSLSPNPFMTPVMISESDRRLLMTPVLGRAVGSNITVFIEPDRSQMGSDQRTWFDGIGYEIVSNTIVSALASGNGGLILRHSGAAGRLYSEEWTGALNPPVAWSPLQTNTADALGGVSFTNTPTGSPEFFRVRDVTPPPSAVTSLAAQASDGQVSLSWAATSGGTVYNIKRAASSGGPYTMIAAVTGTNFVDASLVDGVTYYYIVTAASDYGESPNSLEKTETPFPEPPLVYSVEFTGASYAVPTFPITFYLPIIQPLPDPFTWFADARNTNGTRSESFYDWAHHRAETEAEILHYEIGPKPTVDPTNIFASYSPSSATAGTLTVRITNIVSGVAKTLTLTCAVSLPSGTGPFPAIIGMNSPSGSVNPALLTAVAKITFSHNQVTVDDNAQQSDPFFQLYPAQTPSNTGQYAPWAWGVSRIIDALEKLQGSLPIDLTHIGVTGCSYAGKMALFCGALDERIALTIAQESGGGGCNSWRYNHTEPANSVELIDNTDYNWFMDTLKNFGGNTVSRLPEDHHMLAAMIAPRALFSTGNPDYTWLGNPSCYVCCKAIERIYSTFGIADRFGYNIQGGHAHCSTTSAIDSEMGVFINKFLLGQTNLNSYIRDFSDSYSNINYSRWTAWWGSTNAVFGP